MEYALDIQNLTKHFPTFTLDHVSFRLPRGSVMGFIGENGAGKSTTMKLILNLQHPDDGSIEILGMDAFDDELAVKQRMGVVSEVTSMPSRFTAKIMASIYRDLYPNWDDDLYATYLKRFDLDPKKPFKDYSKGMRMKLAIACALSHHAELLLLDEPTSGLDPIVRDEVIVMLREYMEDEKHSILMSSHITSDLESIADYITFIHQGKILMCRSIEDLRDTFAILNTSDSLLSELADGAVLAVRRSQFSTEALVDRRLLPTGMHGETASLQQIMLFLTKGESMRFERK